MAVQIALLSASSPISPHVELHTHLHEDGMMKMRQVPSVKIQGQQTTHFKSGGLHVMLFDVSIPDNTKSVPITLTFARSGEKRIIAIIGEPKMMDHSKMGHQLLHTLVITVPFTMNKVAVIHG